MPGINLQPAHRIRDNSAGGYDANVEIAARTKKPQNGADRLEIFQALHQSLHFFLTYIDETLTIDLTQSFATILDILKRRLEKYRQEQGLDQAEWKVDDIADIGEDWKDFIEDWDAADRDDHTKNRILSNWDHAGRQQWKQQNAPLLIPGDYLTDHNFASLRPFLNNQGQLQEDGLPDIIRVELYDKDHQIYIVGMAKKPKPPVGGAARGRGRGRR